MAEEQPPQPQETLGRDVFISYASQDKAVAESVCKALEGAGLLCWIAPRDVVPGESFAGAIVHAIDATKAIVLVLSEHSADSQHVLREVERASSKRHPLIAFRIDLAPMPADLEYFLNTSQWLDASTIGVKHALPRLVNAVKIALTQPSAGARVSAGASATAKASAWQSRALVAGAVITMAALAYYVAPKFWHSKHVIPATVSVSAMPAVVISDKSIAVLPFVDMSEKHDQEYFSDGLSEELIDHLAHISDLKVIARTSSFAFKGKNEDMRSIATKLGVANLLEGSVRKAGPTLRITAQLIRASDGVHLWSEIYDRKLSDIFRIQDEISTTVAKALNVALHADKSGSVQSVSRDTTNIDAYNMVLQGNYFYWRGNPGDTARAIELFKRATGLDSSYALAWAQLARAYAYQGITGELNAANAGVRTRESAERAVALDPNSAVAYYARGNFQSLVTGDWTAALSDLERAVALDPRGEVGAYAQGVIVRIKAIVSGRIGDEIDWYRRLLERNPLDTTILFELVRALQAAGQLDESAATSRKLLQLNPAFAGAQAQYGLTLLLMGEKTEALAEALHEPDDASRLEALTCIYWAMGRRAESDSALRDLERGFADRNDFQIAAVHAYRGGTDSAFTWLDRTYVQRKGSLIDLKVSPLFRNLYSDPRFDALLRKVKLVE